MGMKGGTLPLVSLKVRALDTIVHQLDRAFREEVITKLPSQHNKKQNRGPTPAGLPAFFEAPHTR